MTHLSCLCGCCRNCLFLFTLVFGAVATAIAYAIMKVEGEDPDWDQMTRPLLMGQLYSQAIWFPLWFFLPCQLGFLSLWRAERKADLAGLESPVQPLEEHVETEE